MKFKAGDILKAIDNMPWDIIVITDVDKEQQSYHYKPFKTKNQHRKSVETLAYQIEEVYVNIKLINFNKIWENLNA